MSAMGVMRQTALLPSGARSIHYHLPTHSYFRDLLLLHVKFQTTHLRAGALVFALRLLTLPLPVCCCSLYHGSIC